MLGIDSDLRRCEILWQQRLEVFGVVRLGDFGKNPAQIMVRLQGASFRRFDQTVEMGAGVSPAYGVTE